MFAPNAGMLYPLKDENCKLWDDGLLPPTTIDLADDAESFYSLSDKFHQFSKKRTYENAFREMKLCNLSTRINSSVAEQGNALMSKDR